MHTVSTHNTNVKSQTSSTQPLIRAFHDGLVAAGLDPAVANARTSWVERFRTFRARPGDCRPLEEDLCQFEEAIRAEGQTPEEQVHVALSAIQQFVA